MEKVNLGKYVNIKTGKLDANASNINGKYPFFTCSNEPLRIDDYSYDCECVLVAGNGDLNVKYYNGKFDAYQRTYIIESKDKKLLNTKYLYYLISSNVGRLRNNAIGGVIKYIKLGNLTNIELKLIEINMQNYIVNELDKVQEIIDLRKKQIEELDELIKSQFVEMFGIPFLNDKRWKMGTIRNLVSEVKYGTSKPANGGKYKYLRMNNITYDGNLDLNDIKYINISEDEVEKYTTKKGDILFNRTNSRDLVGKTCVFNSDEKMVIAGFIIRVRANDLANPYFISTYLNTIYLKNKLYNMCKNASGQSNINAQELQNIEIYIPPIELQNQFANIVKQIDKQKFEIEKSLKETEGLQESLMNKYFN